MRSGKLYSNEHAIISLTSWPRRIHTTGLTIFSLLKWCPSFHIVLVLSVDEFPNKCQSLPDELQTIIDRNLIEVLWLPYNLRSFKKLLPTQHVYPTVPIILADDGIIYRMNYAEMLYENWVIDQHSIYSSDLYTGYGITWGVGGAGIIFPPGCFESVYPRCLTPKVLQSNHDDALYGILASKLRIPFKKSPTINWRMVYTDTEAGTRTSMQSYNMYTDQIIPNMVKELDNIC